MRIKLSTTLLTLALFSLFVSASMAQSKVMSLTTNGFCKQASQFNTACKKNWETIAAFCEKVKLAEDSNTLDTIDCDEIGPAHALAQQILRDGQALKNMREPAGVDWLHRGKFCADTLRSATGKLKAIQSGMEKSAEAEKDKIKSMKKRAAAVEKVANLFAKDNIAKAEPDHDEILQEVDGFALWLSTESGRQVYGQVGSMKRNLASRTKELREAEASTALSAELKSKTPKIDELLEQANQAVASIGSSGTATIDGKSLNGPDAVKALFIKWQTSHSNLLRSMGIAWLSTGLPVATETTPAKVVGSKLGATTYTEAVTKLEAQMTNLLPRIVAADLKQLKDADAMKIYIGYLRTVGLMSNNVPEKLITAIEKELAGLESHPVLGERILAYKKATDDILVWRSRAVASAKKSVKPSLELVAATESLNKISFIPTLSSGLDTIAVNLDENALGFQTHIVNARALTGTAAFGNFNTRVWATAVGNLDVTPEIEALRKDLFIGQGSPPLTVAAARSFATANRKSFAAIGGPVSKVQVEAMGSRFPKLPANMNSLVPLDYCPTENALFEDMLLRFNVTPEWIEHPHFFKKTAK